MGLFKKRRGAGDFWNWLAANTSRIQGGGRDALPDFSDEISAAFERSFPDLTWEVTPQESGPWEFCVSAEGNRELFDQVQSVVGEAPSVTGWNIVAFRQRGSLDAEIEMNSQKLGYPDIWCQVEPEGRNARVKLLIRGLTLESAETLLGAALILLDNAVGEYDSIMRISDLDNGPLPAKPRKSATFFPLSELPAYLDRLE